MLDPVGIEMLQLDLVVVQQPLKKFVGGGRESTFVKVGEQHHIVVGRLWQILLAGQQPLLSRGPCVEKTATNKAFHVLEGNVRVAPRIH